MEDDAPIILPPAHLYMEDGPNIYRVQLATERVKIGKDEQNDIVIRTPDVDAHHAEIYIAGSHYVLDAVTNNPAVVNGKLAEGPRRLYNGDVIDLGGQTMTFVKVPAASDTVLQFGIWGAGEAPYFVLLNRPEFTVGFGNSDLHIADEFIASPHCIIENFCAGTTFVVPVTQERPTLLNGIGISRRARLNDGDVLQLGTTEIAVRLHPKCGLPGPTELLPLSEVARARVRGGREEHLDDGDPLVGQHRRVAGRSMGEILGEGLDQDGMRPVGPIDDLDDDDDERRYYLPEHEAQAKPSSMDGRLDEAPGDGNTMVLQVDGKGRAKKERYYLPDGSEAPEGYSPAGGDERSGGNETRSDVPQAEEEADEPQA
ncbi:MAG: FHA domain-containing protein [Myxococcota bacterium]|nr:FHA domain-containing protein [Myxococcota bacterium]